MDFTGNARLKSLFAFVILLSVKALAFPEMVRHKYTQCSVCHSSIAGGDLTTAYGKELGKELLYPKEPWFETDFPLPESESFRLGINNRWLQTYLDNSQVSKGRFFIMQLDLDMVYSLGSWMAYASVGRFEPLGSDKTWSDFIYIPRLWLKKTLAVSDSELSLRAGRFLPTYGINIAEHTAFVRQYLNFGPGLERRTIELSWTNPTFQAVLSRIEGRQFFNDLVEEKGATLQLSYFFSERGKVGVNSYRTEGHGLSKVAFDGAFFLIGWNDQWSTLFEIDKVYLTSGKTAYVEYLRIAKEIRRGWSAFLTQEYKNIDIEKSEPHLESFGLGTQYFLNSSLNATAHLRLEKDTGTLDEYQKVLWFVLQWHPN